MMNAEDAMQVVETLDAAGVIVWINGGWGIDTLLHEQTRAHDDLDVIFSSADIDAAQRSLSHLGFTMMTDELPQGFVLRDPNDRRVDFHPVTFAADGSGIQHVRNGECYPFAAEGFLGLGSVGGREVRCMTPEEQAVEHLGYEPDATDYQDMHLLRERFGTKLPYPFSGESK